jgi:tyrosyl-tRNA synthetase
MPSYIDLLTRWPLDTIKEHKQHLASGAVHPMDIKKKLAWEIVASFNGDAAADEAAAHFARVHQQRELPEELPEFVLSDPMRIDELLLAVGLAPSKSEARRLISQNGVRLNGTTITSIDTLVEPGEAILQVGKRRFLRLLPTEHQH